MKVHYKQIIPRFLIALVLLSGVFTTYAFELNETKAKEWTRRDCREIRRMASFTVSPRCSFSVIGVENYEKDGVIISAVNLYSKGFLYDITFTVVYGISNSGTKRQLLAVKEGSFAGLSSLAENTLSAVAESFKEDNKSSSTNNGNSSYVKSLTPVKPYSDEAERWKIICSNGKSGYIFRKKKSKRWDYSFLTGDNKFSDTVFGFSSKEEGARKLCGCK
jgi:hypothetical protein